MTNRSQKCGQRTAICHFSLVICQISLCGLCGREKKCIVGFQSAKVVLTQKELSRLRCRRDAGATIFSHDLCLCDEIFIGGFSLRGRKGPLPGTTLVALLPHRESVVNPLGLESC